nr:hypothetical protein L204_05205 [Cryptococcus depauperatus CBS 7855]
MTVDASKANHHFFDGNSQHTLPSATAGTGAPLTAIPYELSKGFQHLVDKPKENQETIKKKIAKLQDGLPQLGSYDLRQAKADIVYLNTILDDEPDIAQILAGATWSANYP